MNVDLQAVVEMFQAESQEGLQAMEQALIEIEAQPDDAEAIATVFRAVHTLKGNASSLGFHGLSGLAHTLEDLLDELRKGALRVDRGVVSLLLESVDGLRALLSGAEAGRDELTEGQRAFQQRLEAARTAPASAGPADAAERWAEARHGAGRRSEDRDREGTMRVNIRKLDRMLDLTGEIAIAHGRLQQALGELGAAGGIALDVHQDLGRRFGELQEMVMQARMVPLGPVFRRFTRVVRDVAASRGKQVRLEIEGEDVEVDTSVVDHIRDPLTHLVRNALDHGIEAPEARRAAGKDPRGLVRLRAAHRAGNLVIEVEDDGAGLDRRRILSRARALGLVGEAAQQGGDELERLIFEPGFSTAEAVTDLSGRGVGLDVVRRNVEALRGAVEVRSAAGHGTTVTLRLPLTLAIIAGLNVGVDEEVFVVPLDAVVECVELWQDRCSEDGGRGVLNLRGESLPYVRVRDLLGFGGAPPRRERVVVVQNEEGRAGLAVDVVHGEGQAVVKPLGRLFRKVPGVSGVTILGDGRVALILDVAALLRQERGRIGAAWLASAAMDGGTHGASEGAPTKGAGTC
jgi:two-component system chemotaxis sensor kinase CheA